MATRSDFAQKLLTDLRMRKERMSTPAIPTHSTSNTKGMTRDSYGNSSQNYAESRQTRSSKSVGDRPTNSQRRLNNGAKSLNIQESTTQLVQYKGGQISKQNGDLSRTLAFAFGNNKSFTKINSSSSNNPILSFLHRIGRRALDIGKMERRNITTLNKPSNQIINVSNIHINEISKGIQKLNQILSAYSNSITFDKHSIEMGRELLKGAMDLEEMLTSIHEDSSQLVNPRRKTRIKLLNENGEEEEEEEKSALVAQKKLVERPRFSFDKPSRNSRDTKHVMTSDPKSSLLALNHTTEDKKLFTKQPSSISNDVFFHKRAASCSPDFRPHGKRPSVIAKLMGLEEVPRDVNFESTPGRFNDNRNGKVVANLTKKTEDTAPTAYGRKLMQNADGFRFQNTKSLLKDFDKVVVRKSVSGPQVNEEFLRSNKSTNDLQVKMRRKGTEKHGKDIGVEKGQAKRVMNRDHKDAEARKTHLQEKRNTDAEVKPRVEKREQIIIGKKSSKDFHDKKPHKSSTSSKHKTGIPRNGKSMNLPANTRNLMFLNSCLSETPNDAVSKTTKISRVSTPPIKEDKSINMVAIERESPRRKHKVVTKRKETIENTELALKDQTPFLLKEKQLEYKGGAENSSNNTGKEADIHIISPNNLETRAMILVEDFASDKEASELPSPIVVQDLSSLDERSQDTATKISIDPIDDEDRLATSLEESGKMSSKLELVYIKETDELSDKEVDVLQSPITFSDLPAVSKDSQEIMAEISIGPIDNEDQMPDFKEGTSLESQKIEMFSENGCNESSLDNSNTQQHEQKENQIPEYCNKLLIESEFHLKQTLLKSRPLLNAAHETFYLYIPVDFPNPSDDIIQDEDNKLILDVVHELTRKKGKRLDLSLYPSMNILNFYVKVESFDDLVKQLYTDFKKLTAIYEGTNEEQDSAEYIQEMLERDIENRDTDVNAMWDMGWNDVLFGIIERYELTKVVEMYLIDVLIEDIAKELLSLDGYI